jgi:hypothetical protein
MRTSLVIRVRSVHPALSTHAPDHMAPFHRFPPNSSVIHFSTAMQLARQPPSVLILNKNYALLLLLQVLQASVPSHTQLLIGITAAAAAAADAPSECALTHGAVGLHRCCCCCCRCCNRLLLPLAVDGHRCCCCCRCFRPMFPHTRSCSSASLLLLPLPLAVAGALNHCALTD